MKRNIRQILATLLILAICLSTVDIHALAEDNDLELLQTEETVSDGDPVSAGDVIDEDGIDEDAAKEETTENTWDGTTTESIYEGENFKVIFSLIGYWAGGYHADIEIENTGDSDIENWYLFFYFDHEITNIWNAEIYDHEDGEYTIKNLGWNGEIAVGESVRFGFSGNEDFAGFPDEYRLIGKNTATNDQDYTVEYHLSSDWGSGFCGTISITNNTDTTIEDWRLEFDFGRTITSIWNGEIEAQEENHYIIKNAGYNSNIAPGQIVSFGFNGESGDKDMEPEEYILYSFSQKNAPAFTVTFHADDADVTNVPAAQTVAEGKYAVKPDSPSREGYLFLGWYTDEDFSECFDFYNTPVNDNIDLYARWFDYEDLTDTDGDGLVDSLEELIGSCITDVDTDGDGLSDLIEIDQLETSPILYDTDGNGVSDGDEDFDGDGLSNQEEISLGTDPTVTDTDNDKLSDYEEQKVYGTNPLEADTDGDGVSDGKEIELGTNPLVYQSSFQLSVSSEYDGPVKASVDIELEGRQVETMTVKKYENEFLFPADMPGYIGGAYDFSVDGTFESATIRFAFEEELLKDAFFDPVIYYFNEETQLLEALDTQLEGNVASAEVTHFSRYILLNRKVFERSFEWQDAWSTAGYSGVEVVLVIDDSYSMATTDRLNQRLEVAKDLIDKLPGNSKIGVVRFRAYATRLTPVLTDDRSLAKSYLTNRYFCLGSGTNMYQAIQSSFSMFGKADDKVLRMMVVLTDGETFDAKKHSSTVTFAKERKVQIYTVGRNLLSRIQC